MAAVAAAAAFARKKGTYYEMARSNKKRKVRVSLSLDNIHQHCSTHPFTTVGPTGSPELHAKQQWEKEVRRISLTSLNRTARNDIVEHDKITKSDGCIACTANKLQRSATDSPSLRKAVICKQAPSMDSCMMTSTTGTHHHQSSSKKCHKSHSHSDLCLKTSTRHHRRHSSDIGSNSSSDDEQMPSIDVMSSYSTPKYGTNTKSWTVKVDMKPFIPNGDVTVSAEGQLVKIKAKLPAKRKGLAAHIFGSGQREVKRTLKFGGIIDTSAFKTSTDKAGILTIELSETLPC